MSTIKASMTRTMLEVFSEPDQAKRVAAAGDIFAPDAVFFEPDAAYEGIDAIQRRAGELVAQRPGWVFTQGDFLEGYNIGTLAWEHGPRGAEPVARGRDVAIAENGRIRSLYVLIEAAR